MESSEWNYFHKYRVRGDDRFRINKTSEGTNTVSAILRDVISLNIIHMNPVILSTYCLLLFRSDESFKMLPRLDGDCCFNVVEIIFFITNIYRLTWKS